MGTCFKHEVHMEGGIGDTADSASSVWELPNCDQGHRIRGLSHPQRLESRLLCVHLFLPTRYLIFHCQNKLIKGLLFHNMAGLRCPKHYAYGLQVLHRTHQVWSISLWEALINPTIQLLAIWGWAKNVPWNWVFKGRNNGGHALSRDTVPVEVVLQRWSLQEGSEAYACFWMSSRTGVKSAPYNDLWCLK